MIDWLIIYECTSSSRIFHLYGDVIISTEGLQNLGLCSALRASEQGGIFILPHLPWHRVSVFLVSYESPSHSVASYDTWSILTRSFTRSDQLVLQVCFVNSWRSYWEKRWMIWQKISKQQFGYIKGRSTTLQIIKVIHGLSEVLNNGGKINYIYGLYESFW
jgi:hypothetical protein